MKQKLSWLSNKPQYIYYIIVSVTLCMPSIVQAQGAVRISSSFNDQQGRIHLEWPSKIELSSTEAKGSELFLKFNKALGDVNFKKVLDDGAEYLHSIDYGFDTLLLRAKKDVEYDVVSDGRSVCIKINLKSSPALSSAAIQIEVTQARLLVEEGRVDEGLKQLAKLIDSNPNNIDLYLSAASITASARKQSQALSYLDKALELGADADRVKALQEEITELSRPYIKAGREVRESADIALQQITHVELDSSLSDSEHHVGAAYRANTFRIDSITRADGSVAEFKDERNHFDLYYRYRSDEDKLKLSFFGSDEEYGGGAEYSFLDHKGNTDIVFEGNRPQWNFVEMIADYGTRDRIGLYRLHRFNRNFTSELGVYGQRYSLKGVSDAARSVKIDLGLNYFLLAENPIIWLSYGLDAEYETKLEKRDNINGVRFSPLPLESREVHILNLAISYAFGQGFFGGGYAGYAQDRLGEGAPHFAVNFTYLLSNVLELKAEASRSLSTTGVESGSGGNEDRAVVWLSWYF